MKKCCVFALLAIAASGACSEPQAAPWPAVLLDEPFHVGDESNSDMKHSRPDGTNFVATFTLPAGSAFGIRDVMYASIHVGGMMPWDDRSHSEHFKAGRFLTKLYINSEEVAVLNKRVRGRDSVFDVAKIHVRIPSSVVREGQNEIRIDPGIKGSNRDDFELYKVVVGNKHE